MKRCLCFSACTHPWHVVFSWLKWWNATVWHFVKYHEGRGLVSRVLLKLTPTYLQIKVKLYHNTGVLQFFILIVPQHRIVSKCFALNVRCHPVVNVGKLMEQHVYQNTTFVCCIFISELPRIGADVGFNCRWRRIFKVFIRK